MISSHFFKSENLVFQRCLFVSWFWCLCVAPSAMPTGALCLFSLCLRSLHMPQVLSRHTLGIHIPNPPICHQLYKLHVCPHRGACMFRVLIWASFLQPVSCLSRRECMCKLTLSSHVCGSELDLCSYAHMHHVSPGRTLSHLQETLWEWVWESLRGCMCKAVRWICVHHGRGWPWGRDSRSEQRVVTKEQQI